MRPSVPFLLWLQNTSCSLGCNVFWLQCTVQKNFLNLWECKGISNYFEFFKKYKQSLFFQKSTNCNWLKAVGGVQGVFCMLGSYESAAPYETSTFYRLFISRLVFVQDMFHQSSAAPAKMRNIPIRSLLKNHA